MKKNNNFLNIMNKNKKYNIMNKKYFSWGIYNLI